MHHINIITKKRLELLYFALKLVAEPLILLNVYVFQLKIRFFN